MKKILALVFAFTLIFTAVAHAGDVVIQLGFENSITEPVGQGLQRWKDLVDQRGDGSLKIELFPDSQLGNKTDLIDQMLLGEPVMTLADGAFFADYGVPDMGIVFGPFLFDNWEQCWKMVDSEWYAEQNAKLEEKGIKNVSSNWAYGVRNTLTTKPVHSVADLKGLQIRVPTNQIQTKGFEVLGATPVGMSLGDVYTALQQGTIDGGENPVSVLYGRKHHEVAKYLCLDGHVYNFTNWIMSASLFNSLTPEQQKLLVDTGREAGVYNNTLQAESDAHYIDLMVKEGVTVYTPNAEEMKGFKDAALAFYQDGKIFGWSDGLYEKVQAIFK